MTRKQKRLSMILGGAVVLSLAAFLVGFALKDNISLFKTPSEVAQAHIEPGQRFRLGGMVEKGSVKKNGTFVSFAVTDTVKSINVSYNGILPSLFTEGQGVVTEGKLQEDGTFVADTVLAKHDEKYMPKELADSLRAKGVAIPEGNVK